MLAGRQNKIYYTAIRYVIYMLPAAQSRYWPTPAVNLDITTIVETGLLAN